MPQAAIQINAVTGSNDDLPIATLVQLTNLNTGGEVSYQWSILWQPDGPADLLSSTTIQNPTFTPNKEGTYLIQLIVNSGLSSEKVDRVVAAVRQLKTRIRVPAVGETDENGSDGWGDPAAANNFLQLVDAMRADPGVEVCVVADPSVAPGNVVRYGGTSVIKAGLPGEEYLLEVYLATALTPQTDPLGVVLGAVDGGSVGVGSLVYVRRFGLMPAKPGVFPLPPVGTPAYLGNDGFIRAAPGTNTRVLGVWVNTSGFPQGVYFDGSQTAGGASPNIGIKYWLESTDVVIVPNRYQYLTKGVVIVDPGGFFAAAPGGWIAVIP